MFVVNHLVARYKKTSAFSYPIINFLYNIFLKFLQTTYRRHTKYFHPQKAQVAALLYRCTICHTCYATIDELRVHMTTGHPCNSRVYYRNSSGKIFDNVSKLLYFNIAQTVVQTVKYQCNYCWKMYSSKIDIDLHVSLCKDNNIVEEYNPNIFVCDICQMVFNNHEDIETHMQKHSRKRPNFHCDQCGVLFKVFIIILSFSFLVF